MTTGLPRLALWLGLAGLLPFLGTALAAQLGPDSLRPAALAALLGYGAVILSFLGAVHWGFALRAAPGSAEAAATPLRLVFGVTPSLIAWVALLLPVAPGLALLAAAVLGTAACETALAARGLVGAGYLRLRWGLSAGAATCLLAGLLA
jgi:hypothetical protein